MALNRFNGIPHPLIYAALVPVQSAQGLPGFDLLMPQKEFTVGRAEHNDICIRGAHISDEHCKLVWNAEKKVMFVKWLPTTNGTWIMNERYECHRLKEGESYPLIRGKISFAPAIDVYGKSTGPGDYLYSFRVYSEHEMEEFLVPDQLAERKKVRSRFRDTRNEQDASKCVVTYRSSSDRTLEASLLRQPTPPFTPPSRLGKDFDYTGNVGHYQPKPKPDGHDRADPDIVWRGFVPIKPGTKQILPGAVELWSHHYGLPVGLHPKYSEYTGMQYDDTVTELDRERLERRLRFVEYMGSAEQKAAYKASCEEDGRVYFSPTPPPPPVLESDIGRSPLYETTESRAGSSNVALASPPPAHASKQLSPVPSGVPDVHGLQAFVQRSASLAPPSAPPDRGTNDVPGKRKRKRNDDLASEDRPSKQRLLRSRSNHPLGTRSERVQRQGIAKPTRRAQTSKHAEVGLLDARDASLRRSTRLVGKPAVRYKY